MQLADGARLMKWLMRDAMTCFCISERRSACEAAVSLARTGGIICCGALRRGPKGCRCQTLKLGGRNQPRYVASFPVPGAVNCKLSRGLVFLGLRGELS